MRKTEFPVKTIDDLEKLGRAVKWQWFEKLVAFVFEQNDFIVKEKRVIVFANTKRQYDVIAEMYGKTWLVECKKQKNLNFIEAVRKHQERCLLYSNHIGKQIIPIIVTMSQELDTEIPVVPLLKLNTFINEY